MITTAISIPDEQWEAWLDAVGELNVTREIEVNARLLVQEEQLARRAQRLGIIISCARNLVSPEVALYFSDLTDNARQELAAGVLSLLVTLRENGVRAAMLGLGLERIQADTAAVEIADRIAFLRRVAPTADEQGINLCLPIRCPSEIPHSKGWDYAGNIIHDVMHAACRIGVNVLPGELDENFDVNEFLRKCGFQMGLLRFVYEPRFGEEFTPAQAQQWARMLRWHGFKGSVVFAPRNVQEDDISHVCRRIDDCAAGISAVYSS